MTEQEQINERLQRQIDTQTARIDNVLTKVDMLLLNLNSNAKTFGGRKKSTTRT